ncbi:hypothetical protein A6E15_04010 [Natrinema saccharevitans]|uniref:PH domain-containing protein n=1 Tax=Natrinema saccharevitans TaxID=301967 RepID=A0A1S8AUA3_9EURY|nr:hypothetical protein [Natrinema saccharevitans]OLZ40196.1 hypothetical protein A6E15_04010 [Natrinema saccharevitans]
MADSVRWTIGPHNSWLSRLVTYAPYGIGGGLGLVLVLSLAGFGLAGAITGSTLALVVVLGLVGGPISLLYCWLLVQYGTNGSKWVARYAATDRLTGRGLVVATAVGAVLVTVTIGTAPELTIALFVLALLSMLFLGPLTATVSLEPEERRLQLGTDDDIGGPVVIALEDVVAVYRLPLRRLSRWRFLVIRRVQGPPLFVPVPDRHAAAVDRALERGLAATPTAEPKTAGTTRPMRLVLTAIGVGFLAVAVGFAALVVRNGDPAGGRAVYPIVLLVTFAVVALGYAVYESWLARRSAPPSEESDG